jgi:hypothetical protein
MRVCEYLALSLVRPSRQKGHYPRGKVITLNAQSFWPQLCLIHDQTAPVRATLHHPEEAISGEKILWKERALQIASSR